MTPLIAGGSIYGKVGVCSEPLLRHSLAAKQPTEKKNMPQFAANLSLLFTELPFMERFAAAKAAGFVAVEYQFPYAFDKSELAQALRTHGLKQVLHNLPAGDWDAGERGIACHPDRVTEFRSGVDRTIEYATVLNCPQVNCLAANCLQA